MKLNTEKVLNQITQLIHQIDEQILSVKNSENNVYEHLRKKSLESKKSRLTKLKEIFQIDKYNIVFIGTIGVGKTTAICHLFNLISESEKEIEINKKRINEKITEPLLSTGSGRTTISEVIIKPNDKTFIEIDPYSKEQMQRLIDEFCERFYMEDADYQETETVSFEIDRAIRSMTNMKKNQKIKDSSGKEKTIDVAKETAKKMSKDEFKTLAFKNANLENRKYTREESKLFCPQDFSEHKWLSETFQNINKGEESTLSIPQKIYVFISPEILKESELHLFKSVIDTKGIDENSIRPDLMDYIENEENICVFATRFNDAPEKNIRELMKFSLSQRSKNFEQRFITLVLPQKGEVEKENDSDGTWERGISTRKAIIMDVFNNDNLKFDENNVLFYDALGFYDSKGRRDRDYNERDIQDVKNEIIYSLDYTIERRKELLANEVASISDNYSKIISGKGLSDSQIALINETIEKIKSFLDLGIRIQSFVYEEFIDNYIEYYRNHYPAWNTKDAIHRRLGTFPERQIDTYYDAKVVAEGLDDEEMLKKYTKLFKEQLEDLIIKLGESHKDLQSITSEILKRFETDYDAFIKTVGTEFQSFLEDKNENNDFWYALINRRGKGPGYTNDVCTILRRNLEYVDNSVSANRILQEITEQNWKNLVSKILNFFVEN